MKKEKIACCQYHSHQWWALWQCAVCSVLSYVTVVHWQGRSEITYMLNEYCNIYLVLDACSNRADTASRCMSCSLVTTEWGRVAVSYQHWWIRRGLPHTHLTAVLKQIVLDVIAQQPCRNTHEFTKHLGVDRHTVLLIFQDHDPYLYITPSVSLTLYIVYFC